MSATEQSVDALQQPASKSDANVTATSTSSSTQQQPQSKSSSYAKIVAVDKDGQPTGITDTSNTKPKATVESVQLKNRKPNADAVVDPANDSNKKDQKTRENIDGNEIDNEDDSTFTPVVSHNRKDRNQRRNNNNNNSARRDRGSNKGTGSGEGTSARQGSKRPPRSENERGDRKEGRRSRGKRTDKDKNANADQSGSAEVTNTIPKAAGNNSNGEEATDDLTIANEIAAALAANKFIEAPLPKINAWKVSDRQFKTI